MNTFYTSPYFFLFSAVGSLVYVLFCRLGAGIEGRKKLLLLINLTFMGVLFLYIPKQLADLFVILLVVYGLIKMSESGSEAQRKLLMLLAGVVSIAAFLILHYQDQYLQAFPRAGLFLSPLGHLIGYAFLTLRLLHVLADRFSGRIEKIGFIDFLNYCLLFPCYLAGPLMRYEDFQVSQAQEFRPTAEKIYNSVYRITQGAFKKFVLANSLYQFSADQPDLILSKLPFWQALLALYIFTFVIYFDFSGYTDVAIGTCNLFGISPPENFQWPLLAPSLPAFWNRWHITFTMWLKQYIFYPIAKFLHGRLHLGVIAASLVALWLTVSVAGMWHGASPQYLYYGLYHAVGLTVALAFSRFARKSFLYAPQFAVLRQSLGIFLTFNFVSFGWLFFLNKV